MLADGRDVEHAVVLEENRVCEAQIGAINTVVYLPSPPPQKDFRKND